MHMNAYGRLDNLTGNVLTAAFLLGCQPTPSTIESIALVIQKMDKGEMEEFKTYIAHGTFIRAKGGS